MKKTRKPKTQAQTKILLEAFDFTFQVGILIVLPLVILALLGKLVDERTKTSPLFFFIGILLGLTIGVLLVWKRYKEIVEKIDKTEIVKSRK